MAGVTQTTINKQQTISNTKNSHFFFNYAVFCDCRLQIAGNRNVFENMMDKLLVTEMCLENMMDKLLVTEKGFENMKCVFENIMDQFTGSRNMFCNISMLTPIKPVTRLFSFVCQGRDIINIYMI